jgi:hypothetical protein
MSSDNLTDKNKVSILFAEGLADTMRDSYFFLIDSGDVTESDNLRKWAALEDKKMTDENLTRREYIAKYGRGNL